MKKRALALIALVCLACAVLSGCGDSSTDETPEARAAANAIAVGIAQDLDDSLDPHKTVKAGTREVMFNVFEGLMKPTPDGDLIPLRHHAVRLFTGEIIDRCLPALHQKCRLTAA